MLIDKFHALVVLFGGFLVFSSYKLLARSGDDDDESEDLADNPVVKWATATFDATPEFDGGRLFTRRGMSETPAEGAGFLERFGRPTPLLLVLVCVELSDIIFAVDSIPAVFGVTTDPFIAFTSNIFAIIGLRSLYSVLASAVQDLVRRTRARTAQRHARTPRASARARRRALTSPFLRARRPLRVLRLRARVSQAYLEQAVAIVLGFVGVKLLAQGAGYDVGTGISLSVVAIVLSLGIGLSVIDKGKKAEEA